MTRRRRILNLNDTQLYELYQLANIYLGVLEDMRDEGGAAETRPDAHGGEAARVLGVREGLHLVDGLEVLRGAVQRQAIQA